MLIALPYLGKHTEPPHGVSPGHHITTQLVTPYANTKRNATGDIWFKSVPLINDLLVNYGLTYVGTV